MTKKELRESIKIKKNQLSAWLINDLSQKISQHFLTNFQFENEIIGVFLPLESQKELNLYPLIQDLRLFNALCIPQTNFEDFSMNFYPLPNFTDLQKGKMGLLEQNITHQEAVIPSVLIIPLLTADLKGYRVGYGKGFYDRYIQQKAPNAIRIGVSLFEPIEKIEDTDEFDQPLDFLISPKKVYSYGKP